MTVAAATSARPRPIFRNTPSCRARPAATLATPVAAKYTTSSSVDVLGLYAIESSISTHTNAHTHGAAASARRSVVMPSGDAPSGRDGAVPRARRAASTSGARHLAAATQPTSTAAAASDAVVVNGVNRYAVRFVS